MAFDHENHVLDPETGFQVHKNTGHRIGVDQAPVVPHKDAGAEYPKWVEPHPSHIVIQHAGDAGAHVSTPAFPDFHVNRSTGAVTVLVHDAEEAAKAFAAYEVHA